MNTTAEADQLAHQIAEGYSKSDIECSCQTKGGSAGSGWWYDTRTADEIDQPDVQTALRYLDLRGLLIRSPEDPAIVGFVREAPARDH